MTQKDLFIEKLKLLKVTLPSEYEGMLENLAETFSSAILEEKNVALNYWSDIISGKEKYIKLNIPNGKLYKLCAIIVDSVPPNTTITEIL